MHVMNKMWFQVVYTNLLRSEHAWTTLSNFSECNKLYNALLVTNSIMHYIFPCSSIMEVSYLFAEIVQHGLRCIAFCKTRKLCELVLSYTYVFWSLLLVVCYIFCSLFIYNMLILSIDILHFNADVRFFKRVLLILLTLFVLTVLDILPRLIGYFFSAQSFH